VINGRGLIYTVEEVSEMLGIPRPTLYRYLREYSIPHLRKSGKISIPEESFDRIREARDLHKEGLGTESVRRALREGTNGPDTGEIKAQIDRLSESLERLRGNGSAADEALSSQAMRTVLARQSLLMSAMFNLTEMMEELLLASGKPRKTVFEEVEGEIREVPLPRRGGRLRGRRSAPSGAEPRALPRSPDLPATRAERFGTLAEAPDIVGAPLGAAGLRSAPAGPPEVGRRRAAPGRAPVPRRRDGREPINPERGSGEAERQRHGLGERGHGAIAVRGRRDAGRRGFGRGGADRAGRGPRRLGSRR
jgi:excisionase family DNA binding protein